MISPKLMFRMLKYSTLNESKTYNFRLIARYLDNRSEEPIVQLITDSAVNDIDLDNVFTTIDRTSSKIGQQYLYAKIRTIGTQEDLQKFDELVSEFDSDPRLKEVTKSALSKLSSTDGYYFEEMFQGEHLKLRSLALPYILNTLTVAFVVLSFVWSFFLILLIPILVANAVIHYGNKRNISYYLMGVAELGKSLKIAQKLAKEPTLTAHFPRLTFLKSLSKAQSKASFIVFEKQYDNEMTAILFLMVEWIKIAINFEVIMFHFYHKDVVNKRDELSDLFHFVGETDSAISASELRSEAPEWCKPQFTADKEIQIEDMVHPFVENCVANSLHLRNSSLLLTGSNMSGKTTFIRAVAINAVLAQTLNFCFAKTYIAPYFKVFTSIRIEDSIEHKTSYFLEEVLVIKNFIEQVANHGNCLFILDEIFKGTNTLERISAAKGILSYLNSHGHMVMVSTHDTELTELLGGEKYDCYHFSEQIVENNLTFDYKIHHGRLKTRNAIKILELYNFPESIIEDAIQTQNRLNCKFQIA